MMIRAPPQVIPSPKAAPDTAHSAHWPLHDIVIANIVCCMPYTKEVEGGGLLCSIIVQWYCNSIGNAGGRGE